MSRFLIRTAAMLLLAGLLTGCSNMATRKDFYDPIRADVTALDYAAAVQKIEAARASDAYAEKDRLVYFLDSGFANHYAGQYDLSNRKLHRAEDSAEELFTRSISRAAASLLLNDNALEYSGEDHEVLYTNLIKALNYLQLEQIDEAFVEIRRANNKLALLDDKYGKAGNSLRTGLSSVTGKPAPEIEDGEVRFSNDAFARWLSMHMYAAQGLHDDAELDRRKLERAFVDQPHIYDFPMPPVMYNKGHNPVLSVVALAGLSPVKESLSLRVRTDKDLDLVQVLYDGALKRDEVYSDFVFPVDADYYFKFALPRMVERPSRVSRVRVLSGGVEVGELRMIENVASVARETFEAKKNLIYLRSAVRAVVKGLTAHEAKKKADTGGIGGWLKKAVVDVVADATENADLRCSRLLPGRILVGDFPIEPGLHDLRIEFLDRAGHLLHAKDLPRQVVRGSGLNLIEASYLN